MLSYELLENRASAILEEWGEYQRQETSPLERLGFPRQSAESKLMDQPRRQRRRCRRVSGMSIQAPAAKPGKQGPAPSTAWPAHIQDADLVIAAMPAALRRVVIAYYLAGHSIRGTASHLRMSKDAVDRHLDRALWWVASRLEVEAA